MAFITSKKIFYVNSRLRQNGTNGNFTYKVDLQPTDDFDYVTVLQASIPKSYYVVPNGENTFVLEENGTQVTITITEGNYSRTGLKNTVAQALNQYSPNLWNYTVETQNMQSSVDNGKIRFGVGNNTTQPSLIFGNYMWEQLGFEANSTNPFIFDELFSTNVINVQPEDTVFLHSDICQNQSGDNILQEFYGNGTSAFSAIHFENFSIEAYGKKLVTNQSNSYTFYFTDENGTGLHFNGVNVVFTLMFYKTNDIHQLMKGFMKYITLRLGTPT